ncbi:MAG: DUF2171 domain-containing protein [Acetobacteraceae bacterium]|nr:DUF2171 domain-containing protein [Acetobacteraceae bacterium]
MEVRKEAIREHMEVIGADGGHVGTVDRVEGERIKLTRGDRGAGGRHHWVPLSLVADVEGNAVRLSTTLERVPDFWETEGSAQPPPGSDDAKSRGMGEALARDRGDAAANRQEGSSESTEPAGERGTGSNMGQGGPSMT